MNFFKSDFDDDDHDSDSDSDAPSVDAVPTASTDGAPWNFGGLLKTITAKSESVLDTYRRDLQEFGSGLRKEIQAAQGSLEGVSHFFDDLGSSVLTGTDQIIADNLIKSDPSDRSPAANPSYNIFSRFRARVRSLQGDPRTFGEEPADAEDYAAWKLGFDLGAQRGEIENFVERNGEMMRIYERLVPGKIDDGTFWLRYFYRVHKVEQAECLRVKLVKRAISSEEEELSWNEYYDDDDDDDDDKKVVKLNGKDGNPSGVAKGEGSQSNTVNPTSSIAEVRDGVVATTIAGGKVDAVDANKKEGSVSSLVAGKQVVVDSVKESSIEGDANIEKGLDAIAKNSEQRSDGNANSTKKNDKKSDSVAIPIQPAVSEEEDLGWDEIEDLSSIDDNSSTTKDACGADPSPKREELRKRLTIVEEEDDLSWNIEDEDDSLPNLDAFSCKYRLCSILVIRRICPPPSSLSFAWPTRLSEMHIHTFTWKTRKMSIIVCLSFAVNGIGFAGPSGLMVKFGSNPEEKKKMYSFESRENPQNIK